METINAAKFRATCLALLDQVERTGEPVQITKRGRPVAQLASLSRAGKRAILGCMEGTAKIVGDIGGPAIKRSDWAVLRRRQAGMPAPLSTLLNQE